MPIIWGGGGPVIFRTEGIISKFSFMGCVGKKNLFAKSLRNFKVSSTLVQPEFFIKKYIYCLFVVGPPNYFIFDGADLWILTL